MGHDRLVGLWMTLSAPWQACLEEAWGAYCADGPELDERLLRALEVS